MYTDYDLECLKNNDWYSEFLSDIYEKFDKL